MRRAFIASIIFLGAATQVYAEGCDGILSLTRTVDYQETSLLVASDIHDEYCEGGQLQSSKSFTGSLDFMVKQIPVGLEIGFGSTREQVSNLCKNYSSWEAENRESVTLALSTSDRAIDAWRHCRTLERGNVFFSVTPQTELIGFSVRRGQEVIEFLGMNYDPAYLTCSGPVGEGGAEVQINTSTRFQLFEGTERPIVCRRIQRTLADGTVYFPATEISISAEGADPLLVPLPRDERLEPSLASQIREELINLQSRNAVLQDELNRTHARIDTIDGSLAGYVKFGDSIRLKNGRAWLFHNSSARTELEIITSSGNTAQSLWTVDEP